MFTNFEGGACTEKTQFDFVETILKQIHLQE